MIDDELNNCLRTIEFLILVFGIAFKKEYGTQFSERGFFKNYHLQCYIHYSILEITLSGK